MKTTDYYDRNASSLVERYDALDPEQLHAAWVSLLDGLRPGLAGDIGAGSGRDARWLAGRGWEVVAVEPSAAMRERGEAATRGYPVTWLDDALPGLRGLRHIGHRFELINVQAVWQHLDPGHRERAFRVLVDMLRPGGVLVITLRLGSSEEENRERGFFSVSAEEILAFARNRALVPKAQSRAKDLTRDDVEWETLAFELPDDGTGQRGRLRDRARRDGRTDLFE